MALSLRPVSLALVLTTALVGCSIPQGAGQTSQILAGAEQAGADFSVVAVSRGTLPQIAQWPHMPVQTPTAGWLPRGGGVRQAMVAAGDHLDVVLFSNEENGLLTAPGQKQIVMEGMRVAADGTLFLPYAGKVQLAGLSVDAAREAIQDKLATIAPSAQVLLKASSGRNSSVQVVSGLPQSGSVGLPDDDFTILDLIAQSGGIPVQMINPQVRVARGGRLYGVAFSDLERNPSLDAVLRAGDRIYVEPETRYFLSFGAAARETVIPFPRAKVSAMDAVSLIGGLTDVTADAKGVLVLRNYPASAIRRDGKGPDKRRMIFAFNLLSADGLFSAGEFQIQDQDLVMVAQSPLVNESVILTFAQRLLGVPQQYFNTANAAQR